MDRRLTAAAKLLPFQALATVAELAVWLNFQFSAPTLAPGKRPGRAEPCYGEFFLSEKQAATVNSLTAIPTACPQQALMVQIALLPAH